MTSEVPRASVIQPGWRLILPATSSWRTGATISSAGSPQTGPCPPSEALLAKPRASMAWDPRAFSPTYRHRRGRCRQRVCRGPREPRGSRRAGGRGRLAAHQRGYPPAHRHVLIAGFVVQGSGQKKVVVRALGPSLASAGVSRTLGDPALSVFNSAGTPVAVNDNWGDLSASDRAALAGFGLAPTNSRESAAILSLPAGRLHRHRARRLRQRAGGSV